MNQKGQSAITDAMFFLLIITALAALMFFFSTGYGKSINEYIISQYKDEVIVSAVKTLVFSTTPRTELNPKEQDNIMVLIREDYYNYTVNHSAVNNLKISDTTKTTFLKKVKSVMAPLLGSYDYMYYIYIPPYYIDSSSGEQTDNTGAEDVVLLLLSTTETDGQKAIRKYYYCNPVGQPTGMALINNELLPRLGNTYKPIENSLNLFTSGEAVLAYMNFVVWSPISYPIKNLDFADTTKMNCTLIAGATESAQP